MKTEAYRKTKNFLIGIGYTVAQSNQIIRRFGKHLEVEVPKKYEDPSKQSMAELFQYGKACQKNWDAFMKFYGSIKDQYFRKYPDK